MKTLNKHELQPVAISHLSGIDFIEFVIFYKEYMPFESMMLLFYQLIQARNQEFFRAGEFSRNQGTSINISSTTDERKALQGKTVGFFSHGNS